MILQPATRGAHTIARVGLPFKPSLISLLVRDASRRVWGLSGQGLEWAEDRMHGSDVYTSCQQGARYGAGGQKSTRALQMLPPFHLVLARHRCYFSMSTSFSRLAEMILGGGSDRRRPAKRWVVRCSVEARRRNEQVGWPRAIWTPHGSRLSNTGKAVRWRGTLEHEAQ